MLKITNLHAKVEGNQILNGVHLELNAGEVHAIMGPNGSGKSTLAQVIAGRERFEVTDGDIEFDGESILDLAPEERACKGLFLGFQYPVEIPGVTNSYFLKAALNAQRKDRGEQELDAMEFLSILKEKAALMDMDPKILNRSVNEGFSGGEKKKNEILQMCVLEPRLAILDETDSGLDIDALKVVANGVNTMRGEDRACSSTSFRTRSTSSLTDASPTAATSPWLSPWKRRATAGSMKRPPPRPDNPWPRPSL